MPFALRVVSEGVTSRHGSPTSAAPAGLVVLAVPDRSTTVPTQLPPSRSLVQPGTASLQARPVQFGDAPMTAALRDIE